MKRTSRVLALALAVSMLAAGCGRDDKKAEGGDKTTESAKGTDGKSAGGDKLIADPKADCADYQGTAGIEGDTIKIGTVRPASGAYSIYDTVTKGLEKKFEFINNAGGIKTKDGKTYKLTLIKEDDAYDPAKTPVVVKKLVEEDKVFALVGDIGTETSLAVRDYLTEKCVPLVSLGTGSPHWNEAAKYPWYFPGLPNYATEAHTFMEYVNKTKPDAKIAVLAQSDDFGQSYLKAIKKYIADNKSKMTVVAEQPYDPSTGATTEGAVASLASSKADVLYIGIGGTQCAKTLGFIPADWKPMTYISIPCSGKLSMALAGGKDEGVYTTQGFLDPGSPTDAQNPKVQQMFKDTASVGLAQAEVENGIVAVGWGFGAIFEYGMTNAETADRAALMNALYSMKDADYGLLRDGVKGNTSPKDPWILEQLRVVQRGGGDWKEVAPALDLNGKSASF